MTGDNVYPGRLYVKDWKEYRSSIGRLVEFAKDHDISAVLGTHIEMSRTGMPFPPGSTFQPNEASLSLTVGELVKLNESLGKAGDEPKEIATATFIVSPIGLFQRVLASVLRFIGVR